MKPLKTDPARDVLVERRGRVPQGADRYASRKVLAALEHVGEPVLAARVKLVQAANPAVVRAASAQALVNLNGRPVRAHVAATTMYEAVDLLQARLTARLARARRHPAPAARQRGAAPTAVRGDGDEHRPHRLHLPAAERRIVRHKSFGLASQTPEDAIFDLEAMDYEFYLFTDTATGADSIVYRDVRTGHHRVASAGGTGEPVASEPCWEASTGPVPRTSLAEARTRLELTGLPFVFFLDTATGRGSVLYHRYDGHYGLITPRT
ncbi:sigma 54 modulation/S30EA ribosomal C-terminal domain-containing protein (plasmid) [Streptomyces sp. HUAS TT3]|uniref:sigma 54 modulation/S30EA ribosomal C-terminal domain-containing protein n=1 Tax=unclassified Streptomyces TaxID=2593676 RepID=UPI0036B73D35